MELKSTYPPRKQAFAEIHCEIASIFPMDKYLKKEDGVYYIEKIFKDFVLNSGCFPENEVISCVNNGIQALDKKSKDGKISFSDLKNKIFKIAVKIVQIPEIAKELIGNQPIPSPQRYSLKREREHKTLSEIPAKVPRNHENDLRSIKHERRAHGDEDYTLEDADDEKAEDTSLIVPANAYAMELGQRQEASPHANKTFSEAFGVYQEKFKQLLKGKNIQQLEYLNSVIRSKVFPPTFKKWIYTYIEQCIYKLKSEMELKLCSEYQYFTEDQIIAAIWELTNKDCSDPKDVEETRIRINILLNK